MDEKKEILVSETGNGSFDVQSQVTTSLSEGKTAVLMMYHALEFGIQSIQQAVILRD